MFEAKVENFLCGTRWLWLGVDDVVDRLNAKYASWSRQLLGASAYRNEAVDHSELGWCISGGARFVRDVALRYRRIMLDPGSLYKTIFQLCVDEECGWPWMAEALFKDWRIPLKWIVNPACHLKRKLTVLLKLQCLPLWKERAEQHRGKPSYLSFCKTPGWAMHHLDVRSSSWKLLVGYRSWCRLRSGLLDLAPGSVCHACQARTDKPLKHILCKCRHYAVSRRAALDALGSRAVDADPVFRAIMACYPGCPGFAEVVNFAKCIEDEVRKSGAVL